MEINARLEKLERENRRMKKAGIVGNRLRLGAVHQRSNQDEQGCRGECIPGCGCDRKSCGNVCG
jgi:hypothetical protein